jgi:acetyl coenzyme A synthetase (ADP forming)-like protein
MATTTALPVAPGAAHDSLTSLLRPRAVAVLGVSRSPAHLGRRVFDALVTAGFAGPIYPVNPNADEIGGRACFASARLLPPGVDLAILAVPPPLTLSAVDDCAAAGIRSLVVITAGFSETGPAGQALQQELLERVRSHGMRMVGPNCMGLINTGLRLNASFSPIFPPVGPIALSSQSGALGLALLDLARDRQVGLSTFVSVGNKADISSNDLLEYWETDPETRVILLYLESFGNPRKFAELARRIGRHKPIIAVKAGRTRAGRRAASSHTAALAAADDVVDELFRATGVVRTDTIDEMFDVASYLASQPLPEGGRIAIVTNAGGPGILAVDACERNGLTIADFSAATRTALAAFLPPTASVANPVDMVASADGEAYRHAIETVLSASDVDALLVIYIPVEPDRSAAILSGVRDGIAAARAAGCHKPVLGCLMADAARPLPLHVGTERVPTYAFPENAVRALSHVTRYQAWRAAPVGQTVHFEDIRAAEAQALCAAVVASRGEDWLTPEELWRLLGAYGVPSVLGLLVTSAEEAAAQAAVMGFPVVAKISAHDLVHKSDVGGVRTDLRTAADVRVAVTELLATAEGHGLHADGILLQPMVGDGVETMVGLTHDALFGPVVGFGLGGTEVELEQDLHFRVAPLTDRDADALIRESRAFRRLAGYRGHPAGDVPALSELLLRVSQLAQDVPEVLELDLNPVIVQPRGAGCAIVDARVKVGRR